MSEWKVKSLIELADIIPGFAFKSKDFGQIGETVIKIKDIQPPLIDLSSTEKVNTSNYDKNKLKKYLLEYGDFIIAMTGATIGKVGRLKEEKPALINQRVAKIKAKQGVNNDFVYYSVTSSDFQAFIQNNIDSHSAQENISGNSIGRFPILTPPLPEQTAIASILSSLDDKIDLLHRQNTTLEKMAETLFRQWFVEEAQEDWEVVPLEVLGKIICGKTPSKKISKYFNGDIPFIKIPDMHGMTFVFDCEDSLSKAGINSQLNKTIPPKSICVSCIATVGLVVMNAKISQTNQQINSIVPDKDIYRYFIYLKMLTIKDDLLAMASGGTATDNLNTGNFSKIPIQVPDDYKLQAFHKTVEPFFDKIYINQTQIRILTALRDTLLPKLMSGEVRVG